MTHQLHHPPDDSTWLEPSGYPPAVPHQAGPPAASPPPAPLSPAPPPAAAPRPQAQNRYLAPAIEVVGAVLMLLGSVMPWARILTPFGDLTLVGTDVDGQLTFLIAAGLVAGAVLCTSIRKFWLRVAQVFAATCGLAISAFIVLNAFYTLSETEEGLIIIQVQPGAGLYVLGVGAVVALVGAAMHAFLPSD